MNLGNGEYLMISNCMNMPYKASKIINFLESIDSEIIVIDSIICFDTPVNSINYQLVWNGVKVKEMKKFKYDYLDQYPLSSLDIKFINGLIGRIQINFLDIESYEISFLTNYSEIFEECNNEELVASYTNYIEKLGYKMFEYLNPIYGVIGIEVICEGLKDLKKNKENLPCEKVYFSNEILNMQKLDETNKLFFLKKLIYGSYFRHSEVSNYSYKCSNLEKNEIYKIIKI